MYRQVLCVFHEASTALLPATLMSLATVTEALARISEGQFARRGYFLKVLLRNAEDSQRRGLALAPRVIEQISRANEAHAGRCPAQNQGAAIEVCGLANCCASCGASCWIARPLGFP